PAYITYSLKHSRVPIWESPILDMTTYSLCPDRKDVNLRRYKLSQLSLLTRPQRQVILEFLRLVAENVLPDDTGLRRTLARDWTEKTVDDGFDSIITTR